MAGVLRREQGRLRVGAVFGAAVAAASRAVQAARDVVPDGAGHHGAAVAALTHHGANGVQTTPQHEAGEQEKHNAAGEPHAHGQLPARSVVAFAVVRQGAEHLALVPDWISGLTRDAQEVGSLWQQVSQVCARLADRNSLFMLEAFSFESHEQAVPVGVVHDAVKGVPAARVRGPADSGRGAGDVVHCYCHGVDGEMA